MPPRTRSHTLKLGDVDSSWTLEYTGIDPGSVSESITRTRLTRVTSVGKESRALDSSSSAHRFDGDDLTYRKMVLLTFVVHHFFLTLASWYTDFWTGSSTWILRMAQTPRPERHHFRRSCSSMFTVACKRLCRACRPSSRSLYLSFVHRTQVYDLSTEESHLRVLDRSSRK
jgi:hypothetical protein